MATKAKLTEYLQDLTRFQGSLSSEAIVEANPANPKTALIVIPDPLRAEVLVSCRIVPDNQYVYAKLADFNWVGDGYSSIKYPKKGEQVIVLFLHGDINSGVIVGRMPSIEEPIHIETTILNTIRMDEWGNEEIWDAIGTKTTDVSGNIIETSATGIKITCGSTIIEINQDGSISIDAPSNVDVSNDVTIGGISFLAHTHEYVLPQHAAGTSDTGTPQ